MPVTPLARRTLAAAALVAIAGCSTAPPGPAQAPSTAPSNLDTGTPTRSNLAGAAETPVAGT